MTIIMSDANGGGGGGWRQEQVTSAWHVQRPKMVSGPADHHGVVLKTNKGNVYLVHSGPESGVVVTPASNMGSKWTTTKEIPVAGTKTVQDAFNGAGGRSLSELLQYATSGTCIGAAAGVEKALGRCDGADFADVMYRYADDADVPIRCTPDRHEYTVCIIQ